MTFLVLSASACLGWIFLLAALHHVRHPAALSDAIQAQTQRPRVVAVVMTYAVVGVEVALAVGLLVPAAVGEVPAGALWAAALASGTMSAYAWFVRRINPEAPCGCSSDPSTMNHVVALRAAGMSLVGAGAASLAPALQWNGDLSVTLTAVLAGFAFARTVLLLPALISTASPTVLTPVRRVT